MKLRRQANGSEKRKIVDEISGYTLQEIADKLGISRERVRQIENNAMKKIRKYNSEEKLRHVLETIHELNTPRKYI